MNKSQINILIVEDDTTQGKALYEAVTREGYSATLCNTSVKAITQAQRYEFHCLMVDCLLPKMNGVDLVTEIIAMVPSRPRVLLFTGIFKDREFMREAMKTTGADSFFTKPLNLAAVLHQLDEYFAGQMQSHAPHVLRLYTSEIIDDRNMVKLIEQDTAIHAFHLPALYQRIQDTSLTGELTMISAGGDVSSVSFFKGNVCQVKTPDRESYFGSLAVSLGFVSAQDVAEALKNPSSGMLGMKLIDSMSLSPHAINVILAEQMALRLSQTVHDDVINLQWLEKRLPKPEFMLSSSKFDVLLEDWMESKITNEWIKSTLMSWGDFHLEGDYNSRLHGHRPIKEVLASDLFDEAKDLQEIFAAFIRGDAFIGQRGEDVADFSFLDARLDQMAADHKSQNYYQILGVSEKAQTREVTKAFEGLKEAFDPKLLPQECPAGIVEKCKLVFAEIQKARDVLMDDIERMRYLQSLQSRRGQEMLEAEPILRTAILEIMSGHAKEAGKKFQSLLDRKIEFKDLRAYRIWAGLKVDRNYNAIRLDQVPPEERHSSAYMMAKGIYHRIKGQYKKSMEYLRTAHVLDPRLRMAKHELKILAVELEKNKFGNRELIREINSILDSVPTRARRKA
jgi:CheY-like chemotaxis protein